MKKIHILRLLCIICSCDNLRQFYNTKMKKEEARGSGKTENKCCWISTLDGMNCNKIKNE